MGRQRRRTNRSRRTPAGDALSAEQVRGSAAGHRTHRSLEQQGARPGNRRLGLRFFVVCALLMAAFYALFYTPPWESSTLDGFFGAYLRLYADATAAILRVLGGEATVSDTVVVSSHFSMRVVRGCDALEATALVICAVVASPVRFRSRLLGVLGGVLVLGAVNLVRLVSLFFVGVHFPKAFETIHLEVWQAVLIILAIALWLLWVRWAVKVEPEGKPQ